MGWNLTGFSMPLSLHPQRPWSQGQVHPWPGAGVAEGRDPVGTVSCWLTEQSQQRSIVWSELHLHLVGCTTFLAKKKSAAASSLPSEPHIRLWAMLTWNQACNYALLRQTFGLTELTQYQPTSCSCWEHKMTRMALVFLIFVQVPSVKTYLTLQPVPAGPNTTLLNPL